ncbi:MAG: hypothetical protein C0621_06945, partial [Desulfuromonas sp.]
MRRGIQFRVTRFLFIVLLFAFGISTFVTTLQTRSLLKEADTIFLETLGESTSEQARNVFASLEIGIAGSLERGEMEVFKELLVSLGAIPGVKEIGLSDPQGKIVYSSQEKVIDTVIPSRYFQQAVANGTRLTEIETSETLYLFRPHLMESDCLRCHTKAKQGELAGVTYVHYNLENLRATTAYLERFLSDSAWKATSSTGVTGFVGLLIASLGIFFLLGLT